MSKNAKASHSKEQYLGLDARNTTKLNHRIEQTLMHLKAAREL